MCLASDFIHMTFMSFVRIYYFRGKSPLKFDYCFLLIHCYHQDDTDNWKRCFLKLFEEHESDSDENIRKSLL